MPNKSEKYTVNSSIRFEAGHQQSIIALAKGEYNIRIEEDEDGIKGINILKSTMTIDDLQQCGSEDTDYFDKGEVKVFVDNNLIKTIDATNSSTLFVTNDGNSNVGIQLHID